MSERENLGLALLSLTSELVAVQHRRAEIEDQEIAYFSDTIPALRDGVSETMLAKVIAEGRVPRGLKVWRRLKHPTKEAELQAEAARLDKRIAELAELQEWIEKELTAMHQPEVTA